MKRKLPVLVTVLCFSIGSLAPYNPSWANEPSPDIMVLKTINGKKPARFPHRQHQNNFACRYCHHGKTRGGSIAPYTEGMETKKCASCHNNTDMANPKYNSFKLAAHVLCKECHKQNRTSAPTKCTGCHIK